MQPQPSRCQCSVKTSGAASVERHEVVSHSGGAGRTRRARAFTLAAQLGMGQAAPALCAVAPLGQRQGIRRLFGTALRPFPTQRAQGCSAMVERSVKEPLSNWGHTARWAIWQQLDEQGIPRTLAFKRLQRNAAPPRGAFIHHRGVRMWGVAASFSPTLRATLSPALPAVKP